MKSQNQRNMTAWVIYLSDLSAANHVKNEGNAKYHPYTVLAVVSARKGSAFIKNFLRNIFVAFSGNLDAQLEASKYNKPFDIFYDFLPRGDVDVNCYNSHILYRGQKSRILRSWRDDVTGLEWLEWQGMPYPVYRNNPDTYQIELVSMERPPAIKAPIFRLSEKHIFEMKPLY